MTAPLIITGMHRSGTSLVASFIQALGINIGENFFRADSFNVKGYFEDVDFLEFQRSVLQICCSEGKAGWPDWGWTENEFLNREKFQDYVKPAQDLIATRQQNQGIWGWKDPRTCLMLDFWHNLLPDARYLFVYRLPWDVADSILRLKAPVFTEHPDYPLRVWAFYNRNLLDFYRRNSERCLLVNVNTLLDNPEQLMELLDSKLHLKPGSAGNLTEIYESGLFHCLQPQNPVVEILRYLAPEYFSLLAELDSGADIPSGFCLSNPGDLGVAKEGLPLSLHRQILDHQLQIKSLCSQLEKQKLEAETEIQRLEAEIAVFKQSKTWKIQQALSQLQNLLPIKRYNKNALSQ